MLIVALDERAKARNAAVIVRGEPNDGGAMTSPMLFAARTEIYGGKSKPS